MTSASFNTTPPRLWPTKHSGRFVVCVRLRKMARPSKNMWASSRTPWVLSLRATALSYPYVINRARGTSRGPKSRSQTDLPSPDRNDPKACPPSPGRKADKRLVCAPSSIGGRRFRKASHSRTECPLAPFRSRFSFADVDAYNTPEEYGFLAGEVGRTRSSVRRIDQVGTSYVIYVRCRCGRKEITVSGCMKRGLIRHQLRG
ncbi:hypothetical protein KC355_g50 [Hortaea werneckii]|nr:hypothetical protein KC355_g50 [Hortaea werneckii]